MDSRSYLVQSVRARPVVPEEYVSFYVDGWAVDFSIKSKAVPGELPTTVSLTRAQAKEFAQRLAAAIAEYEAAAAAKYQQAKERKQQRKQKEKAA